ncbi:MAG: phytanoyl-CoA dioxygenase family protein [Piscinibacter sp.]|nr:phytanoyl-CoA dioxygenase family protein [Piscinibacter sp.]
MLNPKQSARYHDQGFLVLPGFRDAAARQALRERAVAIAADFVAAGPASVFTTRDQARTADTAFLDSAEGIHCFFEEEAFDERGALVRPQVDAINKIGHALHDLDPVFDRFSRGADMAALAADLGLRAPQAWQSMVIWKPPGIGGEVGWHQDAAFLLTEPASVVAFWFALEDADRNNGCLWVEPGGHRGPLRQRFVRRGNAVTLETVDATPWPSLGQALPVEVEAGSLVVFDGRLPHYSGPNRSARSRMAYTLHVTDGTTAWSADNWLRRERLPLRGLD